MEADQHSQNGGAGDGAEKPPEAASSSAEVKPEAEVAAGASEAEVARAEETEESDESATELDASSDADDEDDSSDESEEASTPEPPVVEEAPIARRKHHVAPALIALDRVDEDDTYQMRPEGEVDLLATDIARVGQLFPVEVRLKPPDRFQVICGFRRVKALRFLHREKVLARLHTDLSDEDALLMALAAAIHQAPVEKAQIEAVRDRLESEGRLTALLRDMLDKAINPEQQLEPESAEGEQEIDADELATTTAAKLSELNQDLALLADVFASLDDEKKLELLKQLRYSADLVAYLEGITS